MRRSLLTALMALVLAALVAPATSLAAVDSFPWSDRSPGADLSCRETDQVRISLEVVATDQPGIYQIQNTVQNCRTTTATYQVVATVRTPDSKGTVGAEYVFAPLESSVFTVDVGAAEGQVMAKVREGHTLWAAASGGWGHAADPDSTQKCTPVLTPRVCLYVYGTGLHVDSFNVQFNYNSPGATIVVKFMVRQGGPSGAIIEGPTGNKTYNADGQWHGWSFASGVNFPNNTIVCGEVAHVAGKDLSGDRPCATIHS